MTVAVLGASSLAGRELAERLRAAGLDRGQLVLTDPGAESAAISAIRNELVVSTPRVEEALEGAGHVVVCVPLEAADEALVREAAARAVVIDLTGRLGGAVFDARASAAPLPKGLHASAAASSLLVAALARTARAAGAGADMVAIVLEPASEIGQEALDEMIGQAVAMLNFASMPKDVHGTQAVHDAHSPGLGGERREEALRREIGQLLGSPAPALLLVTPGTFHGVAAALHASCDAARWREAASKEPRLVLAAAGESASPVAAVLAERAIVGRLVGDGAQGAWAWAAADSIVQGAVGNAVEAIARTEGGRSRAH